MMFSIDDTSVNGYMCDPFWAEEVAAGKKSNGEITFGSSTLEDNGITSPDEITFALRVYDSDDWMADEFAEGVFTIYPTGLTAEQIIIPERRTTSTEQIVVDDDACTFVILDTENDSIWGYTLHCYIENKTDKVIMCSWDETSVNGFMMDPFWAEKVTAGMRTYTDISFYESDFEENGITSVEEIEYTLRVYDSDDWLGDDFVNGTFTYRP